MALRSKVAAAPYLVRGGDAAAEGSALQRAVACEVVDCSGRA